MDLTSRCKLLEAENEYLSYQLKKQKTSHENAFGQLPQSQRRYVELQRKYEAAAAEISRLSNKSFLAFLKKKKSSNNQSTSTNPNTSIIVKEDTTESEVKQVLADAVTTVCQQTVWQEYLDSTLKELDQLRTLVEEQRATAIASEEFNALEYQSLQEALAAANAELEAATSSNSETRTDSTNNEKLQELELQVMSLQLELEDKKKCEAAATEVASQVGLLQTDLHRVRMELEREKMELELVTTHESELTTQVETLRVEKQVLVHSHEKALEAKTAENQILQRQVSELQTKLDESIQPTSAARQNQELAESNRMLQKYILRQQTLSHHRLSVTSSS